MSLASAVARGWPARGSHCSCQCIAAADSWPRIAAASKTRPRAPCCAVVPAILPRGKSSPACGPGQRRRRPCCDGHGTDSPRAFVSAAPRATGGSSQRTARGRGPARAQLLALSGHGTRDTHTHLRDCHTLAGRVGGCQPARCARCRSKRCGRKTMCSAPSWQPTKVERPKHDGQTAVFPNRRSVRAMCTPVFTTR